MSIVDSLRKLSLKLTGAYSTGEAIEDNIEYIAENYSGGGGSSSNCLIVHAKKENLDGSPAVFDPDEITPSVDDIFDAFEAGKNISVIVRLVFSDPTDGASYTEEFALPLTSWGTGWGTEDYEFMAFSAKSMYHVPFQGSDQTEPMMRLVTLTLWKKENRKAILYYGLEDMDH